MNRFAERGPDDIAAWSNTRVGLVVGMMSIGALFGSLIAGPMGDKVGRRKAIILFCCVFYVGNTIFIASFNAWYQILIARFISGLAVGGCSCKLTMIFTLNEAPI